MSRVLQDANAPAMPGGVQVGDVTGTRAMIWSSTDRPARMLVEVARDERCASSRIIEGPAALEDTNFTAKVDLGGLAPGEPVFFLESTAHAQLKGRAYTHSWHHARFVEGMRAQSSSIDTLRFLEASSTRWFVYPCSDTGKIARPLQWLRPCWFG